MKVAIALAFFTILSGCHIRDHAVDDVARSGDCNLACLKRAAALGDLKASEALNAQVMAIMPEHDFWIEIAAENGSVESQHSRAMHLAAVAGKHGMYECYRAMYWAKRAMEGGHSRGKPLYEYLSQVEQATKFESGCPLVGPDSKFGIEEKR